MWFVRFPWPADAVAWPGRADSAPVDLYRAEDGSEGCAYFDQAEPPDGLPAGALVTHLQPVQRCEGAAAGADAPWHYIVATDVLAGHEHELEAWYTQEHLPGLAAVPGTARAARHLAQGGGAPRYHACYDLAERSAFNSPAWLAVRGTAWSSRVRPAFIHTRRTMYRRVP